MTQKQKNKARFLDQFYTDPKYAQIFYSKILEHINMNDFDVILEPSAGTGNFFNLLPKNKRIGIDIEPKSEEIIQQNFLDYFPNCNEKVATIGNPPFGKNSSIAIKFFNHAAEFSDVIAFILPRTFRKESVINRLNENFHLIYDEIVPDNSFIFEGNIYNVCCCAQIWLRKNNIRKKIKKYSFSDVSDWFEIVNPEFADFCIQRVGVAAGSIKTENFKLYSPLSHYFIKQHHQIVLEIFKTIDFKEVKFNTAGNPSVSASELIKMWLKTASKHGIQLDSNINKFARSVWWDVQPDKGFGQGSNPN
jgi:hypothetical protein